MDKDVNKTTTTSMTGYVTDYKTPSMTLDNASIQGETYWTNPYFSTYLGKYKKIPALKSALDSFVFWIVGSGYECSDRRAQIRLSHIFGWGADSFQSILGNMLTTMFINGDSYSQIIRNENKTLINLKMWDPSFVKTVVDNKGVIIGYDKLDNNNKVEKRYKPSEVFHLSNNRVASEIHGVSKIESVEWLIEWWEEMLKDLRRTQHISTIRVLYVPLDDSTRLNTLKTQYQDAIKNHELMIFPVIPGQAKIEDLGAPNVTITLEALRYVEGLFYKSFNVPEVILGGSQNYTEASSKVATFTFEQPYLSQQRLLEEQIRNQLGIDLKLNEPKSMKDDIAQNEAKNTGQVGFQPNDTKLGLSRSE